MKRYGNLFEQVIDFDNLMLAARKTLSGHKDKVAVAQFYFHLETEVIRLQEELEAATYHPSPYRSFEIYEPKRRLICAASVRDRVVHHAICNVLEPIFERQLIGDTYACRIGKGTHAAVRKAQVLARQYRFFLKCDIRKYFASVDHVVLQTLLWRKLKDKRLLDILDKIIDQPLPEGEKGKGLPIGNLTSQHFANLYLGELDHFVKERLRVKGYLRYMDDFLIFGNSKDDLREIYSTAKDFLGRHLLLEVKEESTVLAGVSVGINFLGLRVLPQMVRLEAKKWARFRRRVRGLESAFAEGTIDEAELAQSVTSMIGHIMHANTMAARKAFFAGSLKLG